jgi:hypothetical protein
MQRVLIVIAAILTQWSSSSIAAEQPIVELDVAESMLLGKHRCDLEDCNYDIPDIVHRIKNKLVKQFAIDPTLPRNNSIRE